MPAGSREAVPQLPGHGTPDSEADLESGEESEPGLEEPARLCREAAGSLISVELPRATLPFPPLPLPHQPVLGSWALIVLIKFLVVLVLECDLFLKAASNVSVLAPLRLSPRLCREVSAHPFSKILSSRDRNLGPLKAPWS